LDRSAPRRGIRAAVPTATVIAALSVGAGVAAAGGGGVGTPDPPKLSDVVCVNTCAGEHKATAGSKVEATGHHLAGVSWVIFARRGGGHTKVHPTSTSKRVVRAIVPDDAADGRPKVSDRFDQMDTSPKVVEIVAPDQIPSDGGFKLQKASASPTSSFYYGTHTPRVAFTFSGSEPMDIRVTVVHKGNGKVVKSFVKKALEPNVAHHAKWRGTAGAAQGQYRFRVGPVTTGKLDSTRGATFTYHKWKFPVRGPHTYGDGYGAPRAGHIHQGQDVMASCGTPIEAARGGRVQYKAYQASGAGNYIVIDGKHDNHDYAYMHLKRPSPLSRGDRVRTGQKIGVVGDTGDATACHLHFEYWKGDWYGGGEPLPSVTRVLKRWDGWS
jgi:murein DD-endopeptidase MepM/ murein hydrolase activator NlpD